MNKLTLTYETDRGIKIKLENSLIKWAEHNGAVFEHAKFNEARSKRIITFKSEQEVV